MDTSRLLGTSRPWRSLAYLASGVPVGLACFVVIVVLAVPGVLLLPVLLGVAPLAVLGQLGIPVAVLERARCRWVDPRPAPGPHPVLPDVGWSRRARIRLREPATWQEFAYAVLTATLLWVVDLVVVLAAVVVPGIMLLAPVLVPSLPPEAVPAGTAMARAGLLWTTIPLGLVALVAAAYLVTLVAWGRSRLARALLVPGKAAPAGELVEVRRSRARVVDRYEAERRRIERDLHDGAQQRLTSVTMLLGLARAQLDPDHPAAEPVARAHTEVTNALAELRDLVNGIHPKILADRGLDAALGGLADRCAVPVRVDAAVGRRLPDAVESAAYYVVSEALANVVKHSGARRVRVGARCEDGVLRVEVRDDGRGGADPARGAGLTGLADRAAAVGGTVALASPPGGPTVLRVAIPVERSS
ncbi:sensor histidine kinase [Saccharothrix syringae]|uniref:histidine kinase n=1 Tax=Saccharothrix syringae TaxID=103733 RepID=A0A5Q0GWH2_SACSY|nr:sensor histidine kinase [Saccharothrix syringae]QFZ17810.1 sensor histidine kinase [Saccharothrix syringae]